MFDIPFFEIAVVIAAGSFFIKRTDIPVLARQGGIVLGRLVGEYAVLTLLDSLVECTNFALCVFYECLGTLLNAKNRVQSLASQNAHFGDFSRSLEKEFESLSEIGEEIQSTRINTRNLVMGAREMKKPPTLQELPLSQPNLMQGDERKEQGETRAPINPKLKEYIVADQYFKAVDEEKALTGLQASGNDPEAFEAYFSKKEQTTGKRNGASMVERALLQSIMEKQK